VTTLQDLIARLEALVESEAATTPCVREVVASLEAEIPRGR